MVAILWLVATPISIQEEGDPAQEDIPTKTLERVPIQLVVAILQLVATPIREEAVSTQEDIPTRILQEGVTLINIQVEVGTALVGIQQVDLTQ